MRVAALILAFLCAAAQAPRSGNPILQGWYADPEAHVFEGAYWIFPTYSAPYDEQLFMDAFSSPDLVRWTKHERVLDAKDVPWARRALWAPSIVHKDGWYYLFFGANDIQNDQQTGGIGVARARRPEGPFKDYLGKPLIDRFHNGAQPIDQFVFQDRDGAYYIVYGGWRHCNIAKLNDDFTGFVPFPDGSTFKEITPQGYVEGAFMLLKDGKYYFMWSEGGWTGPNYAVAYAVGDSPFGPFERVGKILQQDPSIARGSGHHSVVRSPRSGKYYIVYHRRPLDQQDRNARVVSIEELKFDEKGMIVPVVLTREGVLADPIQAQPVKAVVVSISPNQPMCPELGLADRLQGDAAAWLTQPHMYWFVVDADGRLVPSLQQLRVSSLASLRVWSDRNRNGVPDGGETRPFNDVIAEVEPAITRVDDSYVCRARAPIRILPGHYPGVSPARPAAQAAWEIEIPSDRALAEYRYGATPVLGVEVSLSRSGDQYMVEITNERPSPIEALSIRVDEGKGGLGYSFDMYLFERRTTAQETSGPVMPGESRRIRLGRARPDAAEAKAVVTAVLFEDLQFAGSHAQRTEWFEARDARAASLTDWLTALRSAAKATDPALARRILEEKLEQRRARIVADRQNTVDGMIEQLLARLASGEAPLAQLLEFLTSRFELELVKATRHRAAK